jgi:hypothetical protein
LAGVTLAWLIGETIIVWRSVAKNHRPPMPGALLASSGFFALCALLAEYPPARTTATLLAFGIDIAAYLQVPIVVGGPAANTPVGAQGSASRTGPPAAAGAPVNPNVFTQPAGG